MSEGVSHSKYLGTTVYISPEQKKKKDYWNVVDIYALGIIYFEMNYPFRTDAERFKVVMHCHPMMELYLYYCAGPDCVV